MDKQFSMGISFSAHLKAMFKDWIIEFWITEDALRAKSLSLWICNYHIQDIVHMPLSGEGGGLYGPTAWSHDHQLGS